MRLPLFLALSLTSLLSYATDTSASRGVELEQMKASGSSITGACGAATVKVSGVEVDPTTLGSFIGPEGVISLASGRTSLTIGPGPEGNAKVFLQDRNKLHCLTTPKGPRLILSMYCFARSCAPVDYRVIDPATAKVVSNQDGMDECDQACAGKALGLVVPLVLRENQ